MSYRRRREAAPDTSPTYLSYRQLSLVSGMSQSTLRRRVADGTLPYAQPGGPGSRVLFPPDAIDCLTKHRDETPAPPEAPEPASEAAAPQSARPRGPRPRWMHN
jgi:hypothetical protein